MSNELSQTAIDRAGWLKKVSGSIDAAFGEGYAKQHPELLAGILISESLDSIAALLATMQGASYE